MNRDGVELENVERNTSENQAVQDPGQHIQLEENEQIVFLSSILESSTEYSIVAMDLEGRIAAWNEGARRLYGYEPSEVLGKANVSILHTPEDASSGSVREILDAARAEGKWAGELSRVRKDGTHFTAYVTTTLRRDASRTPIGFTMISRDLTHSQQIERELRDSQEYNRGLIESNVDALMTTDPLGIITDVNRQMCKMTGFDREQLVGTPFKDYFTDPQRAEDGIRQVLAEDRVTNYELTMQSRDGRHTVVSYNATTFRSADGRLRGVFAAARDITAQKRLEDELRQTQNYTRGLIEASVDAMMTVDPELRITDVNEQTVRVTGFGREELLGSPFPDFFTDAARAVAGVRQTLADGFVTNYVLVLRAKTGQETTVSFNASVFKDTQGNVRGIFAAARDITAQRRLEDELRRAQNYTRGLIESSIDPMITVDPDLTITDVNEQMARLAEVSKDGLIGSRFDRYFTEPDRAAAGVRRTLREGFVTNYELTRRTPSGREILISFNASIFRDPEGDVRGVFAVARDVTEQRRLEEQLREQQNYSRGLIEASVDALMTVNPDGMIADVNEQTVRLTGFRRQQLIGSRFADYFTEPERAMAGVRRTFDEGVVTDYELIVRSKSGAEMVVSFNASLYKDTNGKVAGILAAARDITQRMAIEQKLREQQAYSRGLIEASVDALMTTDLVGIITDVNRQMCEITSRDRTEILGTPFKDYFTDPDRAQDGIRRVLAEGRVTNYELTIRARDGKETVVSYNATTFTGPDGKLRGVFAGARDITEQKSLEEQFRQAQNYNRGLIESSVDAMLTVDPHLTITDVNEQMVKLTGYTREHLIGSAFHEFFTEPDRATAGVQKTLADGFVTNYELMLRSRFRREILVSFNASVFKDTDGKVRGIFAVARDVTEQRRLEEQLREQQNYNRGLIESSVDALVTVDPDLTITDVNEQMVRLTGYDREELIGSSFKQYFTEPERASVGVRQTLSRGSVTNYELVLKSRSGKRTVVSFNAGTFNDTAGRVAGILAAARDITAQKRLEEQLRDQQNYNRSLIESSVDAMMTVDPNGVITDVNEQTVRLIGVNRRQLVGSSFVDFFTDRARAEAGVRTTFEGGVVTNYELVARARSGRKIPVSFNASVFRDASGAVGGMLAAAREITQQKQIEQELREQQSYTRGLIESNIDALMTTDPLGLITDVNRQMCQLTNQAREELIGTPFKNYFTDPQRAEDGIRRVLAEDRVTNYELTMRSTDGRETVVSYNATTFRSADGRLKGVFAAARDITDQKALASQITHRNRDLTEATTFLNNVLESSTEYSIIAKDLEGNILTWNEGARRNYGYGAEEMVGRMNSNVLHVPEDIESGRVRGLLDTAFRTGKAEGVFKRVRKSGELFTAALAVTLRRDASGEPIGYLLISKDITEQEALEAQLRSKNQELEQQYSRVQEANRLKSEFLANMSHELRTPLNSIIGFSELMHKKKVGPISEKHEEYLGDILASARHLLQLINDVLDLSKVESGKMEFRPERVDLAHTVREVADIMRTLVTQKRIELKSEIDPDVRFVAADQAKLKQVLYNYVSNALKFTPDRGRVTIRAVPEAPNGFRVEVEDTGIGIRPEDIGKLFAEFQQLDASTSKKYPGTGLGLALTKRIVEAQGGSVGVRSAPGKGSTFLAVLPRGSEPIRRLESSDGFSRPAEAAPRILVVEDGGEDRRELLPTLSAAGFAADAVSTGEEAAEFLGRSRYDAILLDLARTSRGDLDAFLRTRSRSLNGSTPLILITGSDRSTTRGLHVQDILVRPFETEDMRTALERAGVRDGSSGPVLVLEEDARDSELIAGTVRQAGFVPICRTNGKDAFEAVANEKPVAVLLDFLSPRINGLEFLERLRQRSSSERAPAIVWVRKDAAERAAGGGNAGSVGPDARGDPKDGGIETLLRELETCLPPTRLAAGQANGR